MLVPGPAPGNNPQVQGIQFQGPNAYHGLANVEVNNEFERYHSHNYHCDHDQNGMFSQSELCYNDAMYWWFYATVQPALDQEQKLAQGPGDHLNWNFENLNEIEDYHINYHYNGMFLQLCDTM